MKNRAVFLLTSLAAALSACQHHQVELANPTAEEVDAALARFHEMTPPLNAGRWEVTQIPASDVELKDLDQQTAAGIRALGKDMNTTTRCRAEGDAIDPGTAIAIKVNIRPGCTIEKLTADAGMLSYQSACAVSGSDSVVRNEMALSFKPDRFESRETTSVWTNGSSDTPKVRRFVGTHVGQCRGDEKRRAPALWSDPVYP